MVFSESNITLMQSVQKIVSKCNMCSLCDNGKALPYVGSDPKAILLGEAPGKDEVEQGTPFVGSSGKKLFEVLNSCGFTRDDFIIINTTQCRPVKQGKKGIINGKPSPYHINCCMPIVASVIFGTDIDKVLCLGNYPKYWVDTVAGNDNSKIGGVSSVVGKSFHIDPIYHSICDVEFTMCYHPASIIYDADKKKLFEETVTNFATSLVPF